MKFENKLKPDELYDRLNTLYSKYKIEFSRAGEKGRTEQFEKNLLFMFVPLLYTVSDYCIHFHGMHKDNSTFDINITRFYVEIHAADEVLEKKLAKLFVPSTRLDEL